MNQGAENPGGSFSCRACESRRTTLLLDMGRLPLANAFVKDERGTEDRFTERLSLVMCEPCSLIQIREVIPREELFSSFLWVTGTSATAKSYAEWFGRRLEERHRRTERPFLVEVGSNDGFFLGHYRDAGFDVLGVDPSDLAAEASARGLASIRDFFGLEVAERIRRDRGCPDLIVARNVLGHVSELRDFMAGVRRLLPRDGTFVVEMPYAYFLRQEVQYDTIFHEHLSYFTITSLANLAHRFGMKITDVGFVAMNGGSLLCEMVHEDRPMPRGDQGLLDFEALIALNTPRGWKSFTDAVEAQRTVFVGLLQELAGAGKVVVGYGAAAKCMTMLNYCRVTRDLLAAIGDGNPRKQGLLCPGSRIPVVSPGELMTYDPDYVMIGAWNYRDEIIRFLRESLSFSKRFIVPLPMPSILD